MFETMLLLSTPTKRKMEVIKIMEMIKSMNHGVAMLTTCEIPGVAIKSVATTNAPSAAKRLSPLKNLT